jgi:SAM-dependent methyltransferase
MCKLTLDMGCGKSKRPGSVGVDLVPLPGVDVVCDLTRTPYPFASDRFDEIRCRHILEHFDNLIAVLEEIHRICKPGAKIYITVPHFTSAGAFADPTHKRFFGFWTFEFFIDDVEESRAWISNWYTSARFSIERKKLNFQKRKYFWNHLMEPFANRFPNLYENTFLRSFPAAHLEVTLVCKK